jgi:hypothetical protein
MQPSRNGLDEELEAVYERDLRTTEVGYGPADSVSEVKGVFCDCGVENARHRMWEDTPDDRISQSRVKSLIKSATTTLEEKGVNIHRPTLARHALQRRRDGQHIDECIGQAVEASIVAEINSD